MTDKQVNPMDDLFAYQPRRTEPTRVRKLSFWDNLDLAWQLSLAKDQNALKRKLLEEARSAQQLERQMELMGGDRLWPLQLGTSQLCLPAGGETVEADISYREIEGLAQKAVVKMSNLPPEHQERGWALWRKELHRRLPEYAALEVERLADEKRGLLDE